MTVDFPVRGIHPVLPLPSKNSTTNTPPQREARYGFSNASYQDPAFNWDSYAELRKLTKLPVIPKGIQTVEDARLAVAAGAPGIYISNHGGRQLDTSQLPLETVLEIYKYAPEVFEQTEVFADGGVRYGTDVLKMMAMGVKMVGMGRPFMFANVFGVDGVTALIEIMRRELLVDAAILGVKDVRRVNTSYLNLRRLERYIVEL